MQKKVKISDDVTDYCIDNKVSIVEGLKAVAAKKIQVLESAIAALKKEL